MKPSAREPLIGWMILEDYCEDMSHWDGVISYPNPTGANLAWLNPTKMIEYSVYQQACKERDEAISVAAGIKEQAKKNSEYDDWRVAEAEKAKAALAVRQQELLDEVVGLINERNDLKAELTAARSERDQLAQALREARSIFADHIQFAPNSIKLLAEYDAAIERKRLEGGK